MWYSIETTTLIIDVNSEIVQMIRNIFLLIGLAFSVTIANAEPYRPVVGERHPEFTLANIETGKPTSLSDYRGQKVLLIHFASW